jgi:type VI secretion system protein VasG
MIRAAWLTASVDFRAPAVRSGHILTALMADPESAGSLLTGSEQFRKVSLETLQESLGDLCAGSVEHDEAARTSDRPARAPESAASQAQSRALDRYTVNLTDRARKGEIDPVSGRDREIRQMVDILIRRRQNNPILTGEAGVGKTAVVEGFALRIVQGDVPPALQGVEVRTLDLGLLQAGAGIKGEFEERLKQVIGEVKSSPTPIILFIDEAHTLIGAGNAAGAGDAANLLKPALARGELRTIAATTWAEYKKYFEKDAAMARRFQVITVDEPDEARALTMMRAIAPFLERHHQVMITDQALLDAVRLSSRYITGRQMPDKAVSVLDTACARVAVGLTTSPPAVEGVVRRIAQVDGEMAVLRRESSLGRDHGRRMAELGIERGGLEADLERLTDQWNREIALAGSIRELYRVIEGCVDGKDGAGADLETLKGRLSRQEAELKTVQRDHPLVSVAVDSQTVSEVISGWTGIPTGRMQADEIQTVLSLGDHLRQRIIGQEYGISVIEQVVRTAHAGIEDPARPTGVLLLVGPSGVGKTETALVLSDLLYGGEQNLITINMSEYQEAHSVSGLKGSPPGYVGYGEGGVLTEAVRRRPYSVVLLDEIEKAHPDVTEIFYQVFDKGMMEDGEGRVINFKNTLILLTSNLGSDLIARLCADRETLPEPAVLSGLLRKELLKHFKPSFLGRLKVVPYLAIDDGAMKRIVRLKLDGIAARMLKGKRVRFGYDEAVIDAIAGRCTEVDTGARNVDHILTNTLLPELGREMLALMAAGKSVSRAWVGLDDHGFTYSLA